MGADGSVAFYDYEELNAKHFELHGRTLSLDWTYAPKVELGGKTYLLSYWDTNYHDTVEHAYAVDIPGTSDFAIARVRETLTHIAPLADVEVWT